MNINWVELLIGSGLGFLVALATAAIFEWVRKPNLVVTVDENANEGLRKIRGKDYKWKFINVIVENRPRNWWKSWLLGNIPAENARAWIFFCDFESNANIKQINGRWASTSQPLNNFGQPDWSSILVPSRESIPVREKASLAVAIKTNQSESIFAFNNESYMFYPEYDQPYDTLWSNPDFEVGDSKKYKVSIKILSQGHEYIQDFILLNSNRLYKSVKLSASQGDCSQQY